MCPVSLNETLVQLEFIANLLNEFRKNRGGFVKGQALTDTVVKSFQTMKKHDIQFAVSGGFAVSVYGTPRATQDLDLVILGAVEKVEKILKSENFEDEGFYNLKYGINLSRYSYSGVKLDLIEYPEAYQEALFQRVNYNDFFGQSVALISLEDLVITKLISFRPDIDQIDLQMLVKAALELDFEYIKKWAAYFKLPPERLEILKKSKHK